MEMVIIRPALAVGEQDLLRVVVDLRIANGSPAGVQEGRHLSFPDVELVQCAFVRLAVATVRLLSLVLAVVADVGIPVRIVVPEARAEHEVLDVFHGAGKGLCQQGAVAGGRVLR